MSSIGLPKDAEGKEIPLDTKVLYSLSGEEYEVDEFTYSPSENIWRVALAKQFVHFYTCDMHLAPVVVLSADGKPVSIGDTVYCDDDPEPLTVNSLTVSECGPVGVQSASGANYTVPAGRLTHERPGWEKHTAHAAERRLSMISDKERSEVAKALRSFARVTKIREGEARPYLIAAWIALSTAIKGRVTFCDTIDVFDALADLIEPNFHCDEHIVDDFVASKTDLVPKAYVVSVLSSKYKIPRWLYSNREAAEKKANEYIKEEHNALFDDDSIEWAVVNEVEVIA